MYEQIIGIDKYYMFLNKESITLLLVMITLSTEFQIYIKLSFDESNNCTYEHEENGGEYVHVPSVPICDIGYSQRVVSRARD